VQRVQATSPRDNVRGEGEREMLLVSSALALIVIIDPIPLAFAKSHRVDGKRESYIMTSPKRYCYLYFGKLCIYTYKPRSSLSHSSSLSLSLCR